MLANASVKASAVVFLFFSSSSLFLFKLVSSGHYDDITILYTCIPLFIMILRLSIELMTLIDINKLKIHLYF